MLGGLFVMDGVTTNTTSTPKSINAPFGNVQVKLSGTSGTVSADVQVQVSNDPLAMSAPESALWKTYTFALNGTGSGTDIAAAGGDQELTVPWQFIRAKTLSISGTGAAVDVIVTCPEVLGSLKVLDGAATEDDFAPIVVAMHGGVTLQCKLFGTSGAVSCEVRAELSNDDTVLTSPDAAAWEGYTFTLAGTANGADVAAASSYQVFAGNWMFARGVVVDLLGTGAAIDLIATGR